MSPDSVSTLHDEPSSVLNAWRVLRERWWVVLLAVVVCVGASLAISLTSPKQYQATAKLQVEPSSLDNAVFGNQIFPTSSDPARDAATNMALVKSPAVADGVRRLLGLKTPDRQILDGVSVVAEPDANLIDITVTDRSPERAAQLANAVAQQFVAVRQETARRTIQQGEALIQQRLAQLPATATSLRAPLDAALQRLTALEAVQTGDVQPASAAQIPAGPSAPKKSRNAILGLIFGLALGSASAFLLDFADRRVKTVEDFEQLYEIPAMVGIPNESFQRTAPDMRSAAFEPFRILRSGINLAAPEGPSQVVVVTSAVLGEGKTSVAVNVARAAAASGQRVILVEADLRRPSFQRHFALDLGAGGLTNALLTKRPVEDFIQYEDSNLGVLPSGPLPVGTADVIRSQALDRVLRELRGLAALVVVDAPPLLPVADAQVLVSRPEIDLVLMVGRAYHTTRDQARRARAVLSQRQRHPTALAVTGLPDSTEYEYYGSLPARSAGRQYIAQPDDEERAIEVPVQRGSAS